MFEFATQNTITDCTVRGIRRGPNGADALELYGRIFRSIREFLPKSSTLQFQATCW